MSHTDTSDSNIKTTRLSVLFLSIYVLLFSDNQKYGFHYQKPYLIHSPICNPSPMALPALSMEMSSSTCLGWAPTISPPAVLPPPPMHALNICSRLYAQLPSASSSLCLRFNTKPDSPARCPLLIIWASTLHSRLYPCVDAILICWGFDSPLWSPCNQLSCLALPSDLKGTVQGEKRMEGNKRIKRKKKWRERGREWIFSFWPIVLISYTLQVKIICI